MSGEDDAAEDRVDGGEHDAGRDVAADLDAGEVPGREEGHLQVGAHPAGDPPAQRAASRRRRRRRRTARMNSAEEAREDRADDVEHPEGDVVGVGGDVSRGDAEPVEDGVEGDARPGDPVEPRQGVVGDLGQRRDEALHLVDEQAAEDPHEDGEAQPRRGA